MARGTGPIRATLSDVAARAGVSRQTVSNVLNTPEVVRPATRERVLRAVAELDYQPNTAARRLRTHRSHVLGLRMPEVGDGVSGEILDRYLHALAKEAQRAGMRIMLFAADDEEAEIREYRTLLATAGLDGFALTHTYPGDRRVRWLREHRVPFVTFGRPRGEQDDPPGAEPHPWVDVDGYAGTRMATEHLLELGHRRIGFLGWPDGSGPGDDRRAGWYAALRAAGLSEGAPEERTEEGVSPGTGAAARMLADPAVTALVCVSDSLALGALAAARDLSLTAPDRPPVAVTGFDDTPVARAVGLTSVAQPVEAVAARTVELLLAQIPGAARPASPGAGVDRGGRRDQERSSFLVTPRLVVRESSRPAR